MNRKAFVFIVLSFALHLALAMLAAPVALAQSNTCNNGDALVVNSGGSKNNQCIPLNQQPAGTGSTMIVANAGTTGTTVNRLAKLTGAPSTALITSTSDTENAIGIVTSGAGTTGNATITILGQASCDFDNATVAGDYFIISTVTAGKCHDAGASWPQSGATYGRVLTTNGGAGSYVVEIMTPDIAFQNAGNGKSKPGGSNGDVQVNGAGNTFTGVSPGSNGNLLTASGGAWISSAPASTGYPGVTSTGTGALAFAQATITSSNPFISHTVTWNTAATFKNFLTNVTDTTSNLGSTLLEAQAQGTTVFAVQDTRHNGLGHHYAILAPDGADGFGGFAFLNETNTGISLNGGVGAEYYAQGTKIVRMAASQLVDYADFILNDSASKIQWVSNTRFLNQANGTLRIDGNSNGTANVGIILGTNTTSFPMLRANGAKLESRLADDSAYAAFQANTFATGSNCSDSAGAAACGSAAAGSVVIDAGASSVVVSTTAVTANSQIFVTFDSSLGTRLSVTCNTTPALPTVSARTAATSFTIAVSAAPAVNPACYSYFIVN